jgi:hypothetical protein
VLVGIAGALSGDRLPLDFRDAPTAALVIMSGWVPPPTP